MFAGDGVGETRRRGGSFDEGEVDSRWCGGNVGAAGGSVGVSRGTHYANDEEM